MSHPCTKTAGLCDVVALSRKHTPVMTTVSTRARKDHVLRDNPTAVQDYNRHMGVLITTTR